MSITRQFSLLAVLGVILTLAGLGLTLKQNYDSAFEAKRSDVRHVAEASATIIQSFIDAAKSGV